MKKKILMVFSMTLLAAVLLLSGCSVIGDQLGDYLGGHSGENGTAGRVIFEEPGEELKTGGPENAVYAEEISSLSDITVTEVKNGQAVCEIEAPDLYSIVMELAEQGVEFGNEEALHQMIMECVMDPACPKREQTVTVPVVKRDGNWYADTNSEDYQDAVMGGLYTAMNELAQKMLEEMIRQMEEKR